MKGIFGCWGCVNIQMEHADIPAWLVPKYVLGILLFHLPSTLGIPLQLSCSPIFICRHSLAGQRQLQWVSTLHIDSKRQLTLTLFPVPTNSVRCKFYNMSYIQGTLSSCYMFWVECSHIWCVACSRLNSRARIRALDTVPAHSTS